MSTNLDRPMAKPTARSARTAALVFAAVLIAAPVLAQRHASPRGGGSGGGGGGFSGGGHRSAGPSASAPSSRGGGGGGGGNWSGDGHRPPGSGGGAPHRPPGYDHDGGHGHGYGHGYYGGSYYSPYYYPYYGFSFGFGYGYPYYYSPYYYSPYYYGYGYYPYSYGYRPYYYGYRPYSYYPPAYSYGGDGYVAPYGEGGGGGYVAPYGEGTAYDRASFGAVAVRVKPKNAEVYVDGRYVGATGSFDGFPSYLWVPPGQHRIEVVQVGYANLAQEIEVGSGQVVEIDQNLQRGESVRPAPPTDRYSPRGAERAPYPDNESYEGGEHRAPAAPTEPPRQSPEEGREPGRYEGQDLGGLFLEVRPDDASVYLDGRFVGTGRDVSTATEALRLVPGQHRLQVIHPNYTNQERTVEVGAGEEKRVEVYLGRGAGI